MRLIVNGRPHQVEVEARTLLVEVLREQLGLTGTHQGCDNSICGACTVWLDGKAVKSCSLLAVSLEGREVTTIEGLGPGEQLHPVQQALWERHGLQCGFCTPGVVMTLAQLKAEGKELDEAGVRAALKGNLCRCTGYQNIVAAALEVFS